MILLCHAIWFRFQNGRVYALNNETVKPKFLKHFIHVIKLRIHIIKLRLPFCGGEALPQTVCHTTILENAYLTVSQMWCKVQRLVALVNLWDESNLLFYVYNSSRTSRHSQQLWGLTSRNSRRVSRQLWGFLASMRFNYFFLPLPPFQVLKFQCS